MMTDLEQQLQDSIDGYNTAKKNLENAERGFLTAKQNYEYAMRTTVMSVISIFISAVAIGCTVIFLLKR